MTPIRPKFTNPPLIERAVTLVFSPLERFSLGDFGLFWSRVRDEFPVCETKPPVMPQLEQFGGFEPSQLKIQLLPDNILPRAFIRNHELGELIQLQPDRFSFNWIKTATNHTYPHSEAVLQRFFALLGELQEFLAERGIGDIVPVQCELTNVNVIPVADVGESFADAATVIRMPNLEASFDCVQLESQIVGAKHLMLGDDGVPIGRVHSTGQPSLQVGTGEHVFRFDLVARGAPLGADMVGVERFFEKAVSAINAVFLASVTKAGRQFWGES